MEVIQIEYNGTKIEPSCNKLKLNSCKFFVFLILVSLTKVLNFRESYISAEF